MNKRRIVVLLTAALAYAGVFSACSGTLESANQSSSPASSELPTPSVDECTAILTNLRAGYFVGDLAYGCNGDLSGRDLSGVNLEGYDLSGVNLSHAKLRRAKLFQTNLQGANLQYADFTEANLAGASLRKADMRWAVFYNSNLFLADLSGGVCSGAVFIGADIHGVKKCKGADFSQAYDSLP